MFWVSIPSTCIMEQHRNVTREKHKLTDTREISHTKITWKYHNDMPKNNREI